MRKKAYRDGNNGQHAEAQKFDQTEERSNGSHEVGKIAGLSAWRRSRENKPAKGLLEMAKNDEW